MRSGWAECEITPPLGLPMGGRGPRFTPGAAVLDPLIAQAVILEDDDGNRTLWVSVDQLGVDHTTGGRLRRELSAVSGVPYAAVIVNFSHTHSGPMASHGDYATDVPAPLSLLAYGQERDRKILQIARQALDNLRPASLTLHRGTSQIGINRRNRDENGQIQMRPNPDGAYVPDLWIFDIHADDGRAILFSHGCHPVIVYGYAWDGISADFPGVCRRRLRQHLGETVHCQFLQGLTGNVRPRVLADLAEGRFRTATPADPETTGTALAASVQQALANPGETLPLTLGAASGWFQAWRDPAQLPPLAHWQALSERTEELDRNLGRYWAARYQSGPPLTLAEPWRIGLLRLTPAHIIAWFAGEPVAEWLAHLQNWLDTPAVLAWGYCQDVCGYLPTDELLPEGGYEVVGAHPYTRSGPGPFAPGLNEAARQGFLALARQIELRGERS